MELRRRSPEALAVKAVGDPVHAVGHGQGAAVISLGAALPRFYALDESIHAVRIFNGRGARLMNNPPWSSEPPTIPFIQGVAP